MNNRVTVSSIESHTNIPKSNSNSGGSDLWESVRRIIELQNKAPDLKPFPRNQSIPMSFNQERLWLLDQLRPNSSAYNIPFAFRIVGDLKVGILEKSLQTLLQQHQVLRTTFKFDSSHKAIQQINSRSDKILQHFDLRSHPAANREAEAIKLTKKEAQAPFDLSQGPLFRAVLLQIGDQDHFLIFNVHHIVFDGWSEGILFRDLSLLYEAFCFGEEPSVSLLPIQYTDFSVWQRQWLQGDFRQALLNYWRKNLGGPLQELGLPVDFHRETDQTRYSADQPFHISKELSSALKKLARQERATLFPTLLAAFKVLLYHYTEQVDLCVCTPTANRNRSELKGLIGYFVNLLILRTDLSGNPSFRQLIHRVKQSASGASAHQDLPAQELANCLEETQAPLSQILFALQNTPQKTLSLSGLDVERLKIANGMADFDLFLSLTEEAGVIHGVLKYNADLFKANTIALLLQRYEQILRAIIDKPDSPIGQLLSLTPPEQQELAAMRNNYGLKTSHSGKVEQQTYLAPRNQLEEKLVAIWQDVLKHQHIGVRDNFFELGGKSLAAVELFNQIERKFDRKIPFSKIFQAPTIEQLAALFSQKESSDQWTSLVAIKPQGAKPPLFCIHSVEPSILHYRNLTTCLDPEQPFYGLQPPALSGEDKGIFDRVEDMATHYINEIRALQPEGPYFLTGHSMGGLIAYEIACQLEAQGQKVAFLGLIDTFAPGYQPRPRFYTPPVFYQLYIHCFNLARVNPRRKLGYILERIKRIIPKFIWEKLDKSTLLINDSLHNELPEIYRNLPIYETIKLAHYEAYNSYSPARSYAGKITLYRAIERPTTIQYYPSLGWDKLIAQEIEIFEVSGHHNSIVHEPHVQVLSKQIQKSVDKSLQL